MEAPQDVSSSAVSTYSGDISVKYHKLASEYSKMRAQVSVLKKAILEEQSKAADVKEILKVREHSLRKSDQEMESLTFRNQQLARRVAVLQEELDSHQMQKLRTKGKVLELKEQHTKTVCSLHDRVGELEREVNDNNQAIEQVNAKNGLLIERLQHESNTLKIRLQAMEAESKKYQLKAKDCEEQLKVIKENLQADVTSSIVDRPCGNLSDDRIENLTTHVSKCLDTIGKLEQSREHWMLEYRLLQMRYEKMQKKVLDLDKESCPCGSPVHDPGAEDNAECTSSTSSKALVTSMLGNLVFGDLSESSFPHGNSEELRNCLVSRVNELVVHRQLAESKATSFHAELTAVHRRLTLAEMNKVVVQQELEESNATVSELKEELQTTTNNYKAQLSTMSEHLANLNEKLASQRDEIGDLKYTLGNKKGKGK